MFIRFSYSIVIFVLSSSFAVLYSMENSHLKTLKNRYPKIKNNSLKLEKQLNHIEQQQKKDTNIELEEYKQLVATRIMYIKAYKEFKQLVQSSSPYNHNILNKINNLVKDFESIKQDTRLNKIDRSRVISALNYLGICINTFTLFKNPKKTSDYCPQSQEEATHIFLPFEGTARDELGNNFVLWGIEHNLPPYALSYLLSCGISLNECNNNGETALHKAVEKGPEYTRFILQEKIEACTLQELEMLGNDNKIALFKELFKKGSPNNEPTTHFEHALQEHRKLIDDQYVTLETINAQDMHKHTALHKACRKKCIESAELLLEAGANPEIKNNEQKTCIDILDAQAWDEQSTTLASYIFKYHPALQTKYPDMYNLIRELLDEKSNIQQVTISVQKLIGSTERNNQKEVKKPIQKISRHPKRAPKSTFINSPPKPSFRTDIACRYADQKYENNEYSDSIFTKFKNYIVLKKFLNKKSNKDRNVNVKHKGITPLKVAIITHTIESTELLLEHKADPNLTSHGHIETHNPFKSECLELTPLEELLQLNKGVFGYIKLLARYNADFGKTPYLPPLITMIYRQNEEAVSFILQQKNIDVNALNYFKKTALDVACYINNDAIVKILLQHKADPNLCAGDGYPLDSAYNKTSYEIIRLLLMNNATKTNLSIMINQEKVDLENQHEKIINTLSKMHIISCKPNKIIAINNRPFDFFWHTLRYGKAHDLACFIKENNKSISEYSSCHDEYGYPLDYALNNNKTDIVTLLFLNKIYHSSNYKISSDKTTQTCLKHLGTTEFTVTVSPQKETERLIFLKPKNNNLLFENN